MYFYWKSKVRYKKHVLLLLFEKQKGDLENSPLSNNYFFDFLINFIKRLRFLS